jgi:hypothetical protein
MTAVRAFPTALILALLGGCNGDPYSTTYTVRKPAPKDLPGIYEPDAATLARLPSLGPHQIEVRDDGVLLFRAVPRGTLGEAAASGSESGRGSWSLVQRQKSWWGLEVHVQELNGEPVNRYNYLHLRNETPPYLLHATIGDPDSGEASVFERK